MAGRDLRDDHEPSTTNRWEGVKLYDYIPRVSPKFAAPYHLDPFVKALDGVIDGTITDGRFAVTCPVRHAKTETVKHAISLALAKDPTKEIFYITYGANFSQRNGRKVRRLFLESGGVISKDHNTIQEWVTEEGGFLLSTGIDGEITGRGADIIIVDDPIKNRQEAMSAIIRDVAGEFIEEAETRLNVGGSMFIVAARFHVDDPIGRAVQKVDDDTGERVWTYIHQPAIIDEGTAHERALWPEKRSLEHLKKRRKAVGPYLWAANYQGDPNPTGGQIFGTPGRYTVLPEGMRIAIGCDLSYSGTKKSDYGAIVVVGECGGNFYILHVERFRLRIDHARHRLRFAFGRWPVATAYSYVSGTERGAIILLAQQGVTVYPLPARWNKAVRAAPVADLWNGDPERGEPPRVFVPMTLNASPTPCTWLGEYLGEMSAFTGNESIDDYDDQVDATVAAIDILRGGIGADDVPFLFGHTDRAR